MHTELARKVEQPNRLIERDRRLRHRRQQRRTFGLFLAAFLRILAKLHVGAKPAVNDVDVLARRRMDAKRSRSFRLWRESTSSPCRRSDRLARASAAAMPYCPAHPLPAGGTVHSDRRERESVGRNRDPRRRRSTDSRRVLQPALRHPRGRDDADRRDRTLG